MNRTYTPARVLNHPWLFWTVLALPAVYWLAGYWRESLFYGQMIHLTGDFAVQLLIVTLAVTPLRLLFPRARWSAWLVIRRRYLGVAAFGYALLHTLIYIERRPDPALILEDALEIGMWTGWIALLVMLVLAVTSNDASVRKLKRGWKKLHRSVYAVAVLSFAHWILTAFDPTVGIIHLGVLIAIELLHAAFAFVRRRKRAAGGTPAA